MKKIIFLLLLFIQSIFFCFGQDYVPFAGLIQSSTIKADLSVLASDSLEGRETAEPGMAKAIAYTSSRFQQMGLTPAFSKSFTQEVPFIKWTNKAIRVYMGEAELEYGIHYYMNAPTVASKTSRTARVFTILDLYGPINQTINETSAIFIDATNTKGISNDSLNDAINARLKELGPFKPSVIIIERPFDGEREKRQMRRMQNGMISLPDTNQKAYTPVVFVKPGLFEKKSKKSKGRKSITLSNEIKVSTEGLRVTCRNVGALIEGTTQKDEVVVITAHLDHLGKRDSLVYYGADDDGSGCAAILNMAAAFSEAKRQGRNPKRSILFLLFTGEEKGLLGSSYYTENPAFPMGKTIANLNIDMIGRSDTVPRPSTKYVYLIGSDKMSTDLHQISENTNKECCSINMDYTYNDANHPMRLYYRSDHYSFVKKGVPAIFYFTGLHSDYHKPTDTVDKIDFEKTVAISQLIFSTAWELANRTERIRVDKP
ncbi:MAG: M28 family peptidase [Bacteroidota bacterium]|jgi:hypothetical protein